MNGLFRLSLRILQITVGVFIGFGMAVGMVWYFYGPEQFTGAHDPFISAIEKGDVAQVSQFLNSGLNPNKPRLNGTPLTIAAYTGQTEVIEVLIEHGAAVDLPDEGGSSPLLCALQNRHVAAARSLLAHGADPSTSDRFGRSPLSIAAGNGPPELVDLLLEHGADVHHKDQRGCNRCI